MCGCSQDCSECPIAKASEDDVNFPYQLHITVEYKLEPNEVLEPWYRFQTACENIGVKPLWIKNVTSDMTPLHEFITSRSITCDGFTEAEDILGWDAWSLEKAGLNILRQKIETVPWHPLALRPTEDQYFETHILLNNDAPESAWEKLTSIQKQQNLHYSENTNGKVYVTFRQYGVRHENYKRALNWALYKVRECGFVVGDKIITEFAIFDSNVHLDDRWMKRGEYA